MSNLDDNPGYHLPLGLFDNEPEYELPLDLFDEQLHAYPHHQHQHQHQHQHHMPPFLKGVDLGKQMSPMYLYSLYQEKLSNITHLTQQLAFLEQQLKFGSKLDYHQMDHIKRTIEVERAEVDKLIRLLTFDLQGKRARLKRKQRTRTRRIRRSRTRTRRAH
jgi:hypothetical protein